MEASDARRLKALEDENTKLKKLLAEAMLDNAMLRDVAAPARCEMPTSQRRNAEVRLTHRGGRWIRTSGSARDKPSAPR